jgi:elongation factor P hydroxylase
MYSAEVVAGGAGSTADGIVDVFAACFAVSEKTLLIGGAEEPFYQPEADGEAFHRLYFREDFARSALHEAAHWCIAGAARRLLPDFGYWYEADGRNATQQQQFEAVEVRPQALEYFFCKAAGLGFRVSVDNLSGEESDAFPFELAVWQQVRRYSQTGLPERAALFCAALASAFGGIRPGACGAFSLGDITGR